VSLQEGYHLQRGTGEPAAGHADQGAC
jgi:hypothetical protein